MSIPKQTTLANIADAIKNRNILLVKYKHATDGEIVEHKIAPFDVGSTNPNPKIRERNANNLYAYSFTHRDDKTNILDPKVCAFNTNNFLEITNTNEKFDENELSELNRQRTKYDYRNCNFALLPNRDWF